MSTTGAVSVVAGADTCRIHVGVTIVHSRKEPEETLTCGSRQHRCIDGFFLTLIVAVIQHKEEGLVLYDRAAHADGGLMAVVPERRHTLPIVVPRIRIERGIAHVPGSCAVELVAAGTGAHLNLRGATAFNVDRCHDDAHFIDHVGRDEVRGLEALRMTACVHRHTIH